jgi:hypothetical protein
MQPSHAQGLGYLHLPEVAIELPSWMQRPRSPALAGARQVSTTR